jgi:hypothetical protein
MLFFRNPWGLLALLSLGAVAFLYFFVFRGRRIEVSSLHLWQMAQSLRMEGKKLHRPPVTLPFILEIMSALLLAMLVAGLVFKRPSDLKHLTVVLDGSASMNASRDGLSYRDAAARKVDAFFDDLGSTGRITLVESGFEPRILGQESLDREETREILAAWRPSGPSHPLEPAIELARALAGEGAVPALITDYFLAVEGVLVTAVGAPLENTAWVSSHWISESRLFALVKHFGEGGTKKTVAIYGDRRQIGSQVVDLSAQHTVPLSIEVPEGISNLRLELPEDALANDNVLLVARPPRLSLPVHVAVKDELLADYIRRAVRSTERGILAGPDGSALRFSDDGQDGPGGFNVRIRTPETVQPFGGPFTVNAFHALTRGVGLEGVIWAGDPGFQRDGAVILLAAGKVPLAVLDGDELILNLDRKGSNVFTTPAWPVLAANIVNHVFDESPGLKRFSYRLGEHLEFSRPASWKGPVEVERPGGGRVVFEEEHIYYGRLEREGIHRILCNGEERAALDVNLLSEEESDLGTGATLEPERSIRPSLKEEAAGRPLHREFSLIVLAMLIGCWFILERRTP